MSINSTTSTGSVSDLAAQLFKTVDTNKDGKLNVNEFQSFLENLLGKVGNQTQGLGSESTSSSSDSTDSTDTTTRTIPASVAERRTMLQATGYQGMLGFDYTKLNTQDHTTPKYVFARATQEVALPWDRASRSAGLQQICDVVKQSGYPDATVKGDDKIDFGDGFGDIDVLTGDGQWWWGPVGN